MGRTTGFNFALIASAALALVAGRSANASIITESSDPFVDVTLSGDAVASPLGYVGFTVTNIVETSNSIVSGNDFITYTADSDLTIYSDSTLTTVIGSGTLSGSFEVEVFGRSSPFKTGTFSYSFLFSNASGSITVASPSGPVVYPASVQLDPSVTSGGTTTITAGPGVGQYTIDTSATQTSQFTTTGGPSGTLPPISIATPEPASLAMLGLGFTGLIARRRRSV